jgi:hypothetical protein
MSWLGFRPVAPVWLWTTVSPARETEHDGGVTSATTTSSGPPVPSPPARRPPGATWRDPRLVIGIAIVATSVLLGARLLDGAGDTVAVWALRSDLPSGALIGEEQLERREVRFTEEEDADRYLSARSTLPDDATLVRAVGAGELLPRAALGTAGSVRRVEVPVAVAAEAVPATVRAGSVVDVWATSEAAATGKAPRSVLVFDDVVVVAAPRSGSALGPSALRQVIVGVDDEEVSLADALARASTGTIVITKQG